MHSRPSIGGSGAMIGKPNPKRQSVAPMMSSRPSIGGDGRPSIGGRSSLGRRKSMAAPPRQSLTRRSSVYGNKPKIQDPRPISDKAYQQKNQRTLIAFLTSHHYDSAISMKTISSPTRKDFQHICEFIVRQVDPSFVAFTEGKFEEELINWLKWFKYPANISKQSLFAVGSPHTWPAVCAALVWVIELITVGEAESQEKKVDMDVLSMDREKMFFEYLSNTYTNFLAGEDNHTALEQDLAQVFATRNAAVNDEVARFSAENERLKKEIANLRSVSASVAGLQSRRADLTADLNRFTQLLKKLQEHKAAQEAKAAEREKELRGQEQTLMEAETEKGALERALSAQEFSPLEVQRMHQERSMLEDGLRTLAAQKEDLQKRTWELEIAVAKRLDEVERHVMEYNERATQLQLVPATARFASGLDLALSLNPQAPSAEEMLSVDLKETVKPILTRLKDEFADKIRVAQTELREESLKEEQLRASCNEKAEEVADLESRLRKFETVYQEEKEAHARELKAVVARVEDLEIDVRRMRTDTASQVEKAEKFLAQLEEERNQLELTVEEARGALHDEVLAVLEAVTQHKVDINETLHATLRRALTVRDQLAL